MTVLDTTEEVLGELSSAWSDLKSWALSKMPESFSNFEEKYPHIHSLWDDLMCVLYFTVFRFLAFTVVLPALLITVPVVYAYKWVRNKFKS